jgi:hypothetical protein
MSGQNIRNDKHFVLGSRVALTFSCERLLLAESGSQNLIFPTFFTSALPLIAAVEVVEC